MKSSPLITPFTLALLASLYATSALATDPLRLMRQSDKRHRIAAERVEVTMLLQKKGQAVKRRRLTLLTSQDNRRGDRMRLRFSSPANIQGTALLSIEGKDGQEDTQWLYLPAFRKTRRIGAAELGDRFMGSDLYYEDMKRRQVDDFSYRLLRQETLGKHPCWVIESRPRAPKVIKESPYGHSEIWLRKDNLFAVQLRHYDREGRPMKLLKAEEVRRVRGSAWRADRLTVIDINKQHRTVLITSHREHGFKLRGDEFSRHRLAQ